MINPADPRPKWGYSIIFQIIQPEIQYVRRVQLLLHSFFSSIYLCKDVGMIRQFARITTPIRNQHIEIQFGDVNIIQSASGYD